MKLFFALMAIALIVAAVCGAALSWDGSYQFFKMLDSQAMYVPHNRLIVFPAQGAVLLLSRFTDNVGVLQAAFGLVYALMLLGILAISWWIVRDKEPSLFVWAALGIGLGTLPGQFSIYSEATLAVQLFWPVLLAILTRLRERDMPLVALLCAVIFVTHPFSILLFAVAAGVAFIIGWRNKTERLKMWTWAPAFVVLALVRASLIETGYETEQLSLDIVTANFNLSLAGLPLLALTCAWLAALMLCLELYVHKIRQHHLVPLLHSGVAGGIAIAALALTIWASDTVQWRYALGYRTWVLFCSLPFMGLAATEGLKGDSYTQETMAEEWQRRIRVIQAVAVAFSLVLFTQSLVWLSTTNRLQQVIAQSQEPCISATSIEWLMDTPLYHPTVTTYSLLLQGRAPHKIILSGSDCTEADLTTGFPIANWDRVTWGQGWFDLQGIGQHLVAAQPKTGGK